MKVLMAAGKTGGHIFPALALAEEFTRRDSKTEILLVGSKQGIGSQILDCHGIIWQGIDARPLKGTGLTGKLQAVGVLLKGIIQGRRIIKRFKPQIVVGFGGYSSAAMVLAGYFQGIPCFLQEQNIFPGLTNRCLGRFVNMVFTAFTEADTYFPARRVMCVGNPVRTVIKEGMAESQSLGLRPDCFTILVFGGSQGAHKLNSVMLDALKCRPDFGKFCQVIHQTGEKDAAVVRAAYEERKVRAYVRPFINRMSMAYALADLVICRAGATTVSELTQTGKPAILVPYPYAANDHQTLNARYLADKGAALMIPERELDGQRLLKHINALREDEVKRITMGHQAKRLAKPDAAKTIVTYLRENYV